MPFPQRASQMLVKKLLEQAPATSGQCCCFCFYGFPKSVQKGCLPAKEASVEMRLLVRPMLGCPVVQGGSSEKAVITQFLWCLDIQICVHIYIYCYLLTETAILCGNTQFLNFVLVSVSPTSVGRNETRKQRQVLLATLISTQTHFKGFLILVNASPKLYLYFRNSLDI